MKCSQLQPNSPIGVGALTAEDPPILLLEIMSVLLNYNENDTVKILALLVDIKTTIKTRTFQVFFETGLSSFNSPFNLYTSTEKGEQPAAAQCIYSASVRPAAVLRASPSRSGWISQEENQKMKNKTEASTSPTGRSLADGDVLSLKINQALRSQKLLEP
jgi:hypothetical protein